MTTRGLVLFAHGSREPQWAAPFEEIARRAVAALPGIPVRVAYLERMDPDLSSAVAAMAAEGVRELVIVPLFLGQGGHLREDLPRLARAVGQEHPELDIRLAAVAGESAAVLDALAAYCVGELRRRGP